MLDKSLKKYEHSITKSFCFRRKKRETHFFSLCLAFICVAHSTFMLVGSGKDGNKTLNRPQLQLFYNLKIASHFCAIPMSKAWTVTKQKRLKTKTFSRRNQFCYLTTSRPRLLSLDGLLLLRCVIDCCLP